jgi:hypothetical protein
MCVALAPRCPAADNSPLEYRVHARGCLSRNALLRGEQFGEEGEDLGVFGRLRSASGRE